LLTRYSNKQRGALRGTPGSACPQPEPNATELPSCARISARAAQRRRRRRWWRGEESARRPGPEGQVLRHVLWHVPRHVPRHVLRRVLHVPVLHVSPRGKRLGWHACVGCGGSKAALAADLTSSGVGLASESPRAAACPSLSPERFRSPRRLRAGHSRVDRHCHWACRTNKGFRTFKERLARRFLGREKNPNCRFSCHRQGSKAMENDAPLYAHAPLSVLRSHTPGRRPRTPG